MRYFFKILLLAAGLGAAVFPAAGQEVRARVSGLESDSTYMALLAEEQALKQREDSLRAKVRGERAGLTADTTNLYARSRAILRMEEAIFDIRNQSGVVASRINTIEQEFILDNLMNPGKSTATAVVPTSNYANLTDNDYFRENLTPAEYAELKAGERQQANLEQLAGEYRTAYEYLERLTSQYMEAENQSAADSLYAVCRNVLAQMGRIEKAFSDNWEARYDQEIYLYSYLLDKLNRMDELSALNEKGRMMRVSDDGVMSPVLAAYPARRALLIEYQQALARALRLTAAADSLDRALRTAVGDDLSFPKIDLAEREFVRYEEITFPTGMSYNSENPIPEFAVPELGTAYSVLVGTFSQRQAVTVFRGASPVYSERLKNGQWRYYIGLFRSYGDAADAVQRLKDAGFRRPEAVRWKDGVYENLTAQTPQNTGLWRIVITPVDGDLSADARRQLGRYARGKEITRAGDKFYVGTFTDRRHVDDVMQALTPIDGIAAEADRLEE